MNTQVSWRLLKRLLLMFWAVWLTLVVASNFANGLQALGVLPESFLFTSGNYQQIQALTAPFGLPAAVAGVMFAGVILWESLAMVLFWRVGLTFQSAKAGPQRGLLVLTFAVSLALWGAFQIGCEALPSLAAYRTEEVHRTLFTAQLATLLAIVLLPDE